MERVLINSFKDEIQFNLEANLNQINEFFFNDIQKLRLFYPLFSYLYFKEDIPNLELKENLFFLEEDFIRISKNKDSFSIPLANRLKVDCRFETKQLSKYRNLEDILIKNNIELLEINDIEFFEYDFEQFYLFRDLLKSRNELSHSSSNLINNIIWKFKEDNERDFEEILYFFNKNKNLGIDTLFDIMDEKSSKIRTDIFSSFLDTEKIHLQFAKIQRNKTKKENILIYFGFGNYYPFTRNISDKKVYEQRLNRIDFINENFSNTINYFNEQLNLTQNQRINNLLNLINISQKSYFDYFNENFSYISRLNQFKGDLIPLGKADKYFMINPKYRIKSSALIAYNLFKQNLIKF